jgi:N-acetylmuramoyl-L-alanine amidase
MLFAGGTSVPSFAAERASATKKALSSEEAHARELQRLLDRVAVDPEKSGRPKPRTPASRPGRGTDAVGTEPSQVVRRIIVDAGHGGHDTGAIGPTGVREKDVTLAIARRLADSLKAKGFEVALTREDDTYVALKERTRRARERKGDLFVSIHANAHRSPEKTGIETYALNRASSDYERRLALRENATDDEPEAERDFILADLGMTEFLRDSDRLAREVQTTLVRRVTKAYGAPRDLGVKHALFHVLMGVRMPSVLVETAFVTNPREERRLASDGYRELVAKAVADAVGRFASTGGRGASARER